jgi:ATP-binding cassette, subfamily B, bacterial
MRSVMQDASVLKQRVKPGTAKRMLRFGAPYTGLLALFLFVVLLDAGIGIINPLIYRQIINNGILRGNAPLIIRFAILAGALGIVDSAFGLAQSYFSATIGARVVLSLRTKLFDHIQQMPLAFFYARADGEPAEHRRRRGAKRLHRHSLERGR